MHWATNSPKESDCCLCEEILTGKFPAKYASVYGINKRICIESKYFVVIPSVSPLVTGHTMLLPKQHYTSMMTCPGEMQDEALALVRALYTKLSERFGELFLFEHGVGRLDDVACGINHAHLHFVPMSVRNSVGIMMGINEELGKHTEGSIRDLLLKQPSQDAYLMYGTHFSKMKFIHRNTIPSQLVRKLVAKQLRRTESNWRLLDGHKSFTETLTELVSVKSEMAFCI